MPITRYDFRSRRDVSAIVQRQLVAMLFDQTSTLVAGGVALAIAAVFCGVRTGQIWFVVWAAAILIVLAGRIALERAFHRRQRDDDSIDGWRTAFIAGAWIMGALWGMASLTIINHTDPLVQMMIIMVETVVIMGAAARNASCPLAAIGQTVLGLMPLTVACAFSRDVFYYELVIFLAFAFFAAMKLIHYLYDRQVRFLQTDENNRALVDKVNEANRDLAAANELLQHAATTDSLTGVANRRRFDTALGHEVRRAQRDGSALALLFLDIDSFKGFNDLYGHQAGDECLQRVAGALAVSLGRPGDLVARYGGEEFAVILPQTDAGAARDLAQSIGKNIEGLGLRNAAGPAGIVSVSIGVASFAAGRFARPEDFIRSADEAMYAAKGAGRNCIRVFGVAAEGAAADVPAPCPGLKATV